MVSADPFRLFEAIFLMKRGMSMCMGHACVHGASKQNKHRSASTAAACAVSGGSCSASGLSVFPDAIGTIHARLATFHPVSHFVSARSKGGKHDIRVGTVRF